MICYLATHDRSGKKYVGISNRELDARKQEHESHSKCGTDNTAFHLALQKYGKDNFTWKTLAEGEPEVIKILERTLIGVLKTYHPNGFNSMNEASEFELPPSDDELRFFEQMDTGVSEMEMVYDLQDILDKAMKNGRLSEKTKELIRPLADHLRSGECLLPA